MLDISFDTYKHLTMLRSHEDETVDDVIRQLLKLPPATKQQQDAAAPVSKKAWVYKNASLPHGTELRATHKGATHLAEIVDGEWMQNGVRQTSPSAAGFAVTGNGVNGWIFWKAKVPGQARWRKLATFRV